MDCDSGFDGYINGTLTEDEKKAFIIHTETCETCKKGIESFNHYDSLMNRLFKQVKTSSKKEDLHHLFCPEEDEFDLYISENMDKDEVKLFKYHVDGCKLCKEKLSICSGDPKFSSQFNEGYEWLPLPDHIQSLINNQNQIGQKLFSIINRLKQKSLQGVSEIIKDLEQLSLNIGNNINEFSYAFEGDMSHLFHEDHIFTYFEGQNDEMNALTFDVDGYNFMMTSKNNKLKLLVMKNHSPVQNFEIRLKMKDGNEETYFSNENGEIFISNVL